MSVDRRYFLLAGSSLAGAGFASAAYAAAASSARSVADFGVQPNSEADQTQALQKAVDELSAANQPIILPAGTYIASELNLRRSCAVIGVPGQTNLRIDRMMAGASYDLVTTFDLYGVNFSPKTRNSRTALLHLLTQEVRISDCRFDGSGEAAVSMIYCHGSVTAVRIIGDFDCGIAAENSELIISNCDFERCSVGVNAWLNRPTIISHNRFSQCGIGVAADRVAIVNGNVVRQAKDFGLKLGASDGKGKGRIVAQGNILDDCGVGIGVTASGDEIFASLNLIHGTKNGAIRAFDGDKLVGRDLARESAEMYLNLTVAGNVAR